MIGVSLVRALLCVNRVRNLNLQVLALIRNKEKAEKIYKELLNGPVYRVVVKIISIPLHMGTDAVREKFLLAMLVMIVTMVICSLAYEIIVRVAPWMIGKKKVKVL